MWLTVNEGSIEFLTPGNSYKLKRVRRNPRVVCQVGSNESPKIVGAAEIVSDRGEVSRVHRRCWKIHPVMMALGVALRVWIEMLLECGSKYVCDLISRTRWRDPA